MQLQAPRKTAAKVAKSAEAAGKTVRASGTLPGFLGLGVGVTGVGLAVFNVVKDSIGGDKSIVGNLALGPATYAVGGGLGFLLLAEKGGFASTRVVNGIRGGGLALVAGGVLGAVLGTLPMIRNQHDSALGNDTLVQEPRTYPQAMPSAPAQLEGIELAEAKALTEKGSTTHLGVYVDPRSAVKATDQRLGAAVAQARAASQADESDRSHAVVQTADGAWWIMRLSGDLDQVDGRYYSDKSGLSEQFPPQISKRSPALMAIAGVERHYEFPRELDSAAAPLTLDDADAVVPELPPVKEAKEQ